MAEEWRVLEDRGQPETAAAGSARHAVPGEHVRRPLWPILAGAAARVLAASAWLLVTGASGGAVAVNAAHAAIAVGPDELALRSDGPGAGGAASPSSSPLIVEVNGAVRRPGVYRLAADARVADAIAAAGGYGPRVDAKDAQAQNLAARLTDGQQIHVPARGERLATPVDGQGAASGSQSNPAGEPVGPVNVNVATSAQLEALPGIGPATAAKIIAARQTKPFASVDELRQRKVVGQATLDKIHSLVTVH